MFIVFSDSVMTGPASDYGDNGFSHFQRDRVTGWQLTLRQFMAIFIKRFHHVRRSKKGFLCEVRYTSYHAIHIMPDHCCSTMEIRCDFSYRI